MFLRVFSCFILLGILGESLFFSLVFLCVSLLLLVLISLFKKINLLFRFGGFVLAFILANGAIYIKNYRYFEKTQKISSKKDLILTGMIINQLQGQKYLFKDTIGRKFRLYSKQDYQIGSRIKVFGQFEGSILEGKFNNYQLGYDKKIISRIKDKYKLEFNYDKWMFMKNIYGHIYETNSYEVDKSKQIPLFLRFKKYLRSQIVQIYGENKISGLLLGILIGDKSLINENKYQNFIDSGLVHIVAVSGTHIMMVGLFLGFILFFVPFYVRMGLIFIGLVFYGLVCGLDSSVFRSLIMTGIGIFGIFLGRDINIWRIISISYFIMLLVNPYLLFYDLGFLLSFGAVIGIVFVSNFAKKIPNIHIFIDKFVKKYLAGSIGAIFGIFPVLMFFIGSINLISILGNLVVLPLLPFAMIYGFSSIWLYKFFNRNWIIMIEKRLLSFFYQVSDIFSQVGIFVITDNLLERYLIALVSLCLFVILKQKSKFFI